MEAKPSSSKNSETELLQNEDKTDNVQNLLKHWQNLEAEYEGLKEAVSDLEDRLDETSARQLSHDLKGEALSTKDINELLFDSKGNVRRYNEVTGLISRRMEYVQENIKTLQKQLSLIQAPSSFSYTKKSQANPSNLDSLPIQEIIEELDEDDNVISSSVSNPKENSTRLQQVLDQVDKDGARSFHKPAKLEAFSAGDLPRSDDVTNTSKPESIPKIAQGRASNNENHAPRQDKRRSSITTSQPPAIPKASIANRKSVSFAEGTKEEPERPTALRPRKGGTPYSDQNAINQLKRALVSAGDNDSAYSYAGDRSKRTGFYSNIESRAQVNEAANTSLAETELKNKLKDLVRTPQELSKFKDTESKTEDSSIARQSNLDKPINNGNPATTTDILSAKSPAKIPTNESPEDASLRSQMLKYNMDQVGSVVAEIDLDDSQSEASHSSLEDEDEVSTSQNAIGTPEEDDDEDEHGRTTQPVLSEGYLKEMEALQKRLNAVPVVNVGPKQPDTQDIGAILAAEVAFNEGVEPTADPEAGQQTSTKGDAPISGMKDQGRLPAVEARTKAPPAEKKVSRFKQARAIKSSIAETAPHGTTAPHVPKPTIKPHGDILERKPPPLAAATATSAASAPSAPDENDPAFISRQLNEEYHRLRNRMIHREGGFLQSEEQKEADEENYERRDGTGKKVSRFMAARLGGRGQGYSA